MKKLVLITSVNYDLFQREHIGGTEFCTDVCSKPVSGDTVNVNQISQPF